MSDCNIATSYLDGPNGRIFCLIFLPTIKQDGFRKVVIHVPPFAEEMNKCRPMVAAAAKKMAARGLPVVLFDLYGTGDSSGQFEEATWEKWIRDLQFISEWAVQQYRGDDLFLWGLRAGCLLAGEVALQGINRISRIILWQPIVSGERVLTQLKRLDQLSSSGIRSDFFQSGVSSADSCVEIAGYELNADLIKEISRVSIADWRIPPDLRLDWLEVSALENRKPAETSRQLIEAAGGRPDNIYITVVNGEPFWLTLETTMVPKLIEATLQLLDDISGKPPTADS